jgi:hypothetical protein
LIGEEKNHKEQHHKSSVNNGAKVIGSSVLFYRQGTGFFNFIILWLSDEFSWLLIDLTHF